MPQQPKAHAFAGWPCSQPPRQPIRPKVRGAVAVAGGSTCGGGFRSEATSSIATASAEPGADASSGVFGSGAFEGRLPPAPAGPGW